MKKRPAETDAELCARALEASGVSGTKFAALLGVHQRTARSYLSGAIQLGGPPRRLCQIIIARPELVGLLARLALDERS